MRCESKYSILVPHCLKKNNVCEVALYNNMTCKTQYFQFVCDGA